MYTSTVLAIAPRVMAKTDARDARDLIIRAMRSGLSFELAARKFDPSINFRQSGDRLRATRLLRGLGVNELTKLATAPVSRLERQERRALPEAWAAVARALRVDLDWLLTGQGVEPVPDLAPEEYAREQAIAILAYHTRKGTPDEVRAAARLVEPLPGDPVESVEWWLRTLLEHMPSRPKRVKTTPPRKTEDPPPDLGSGTLGKGGGRGRKR